ncbi:MAG: DUF1501 domain-containing protein [Planctomycetaceae bacterium]|nr:DUF1501 domain-containing protein [Planctomycetaceae bacterium]
MLHRRDAMLRLGQFGLGSWGLSELLRADRAAAWSHETAPRPKARSCILLYLWGGPPQQDMWDMKPEAPEGIRSLFAPIDTAVPGIQVSDQLPLVARHTDKLAIVRSLTHDSNAHEPSVYHTLTGRAKPNLVVPANQRSRHDFPDLGGVLSHHFGPGSLPTSVTVPRPLGHDGVTYAGTYAGFLGPRHDPFEVRPLAGRYDAPLENLEPIAGLNDTRLLARHGLLEVLEAHDARWQRDPAVSSLDAFRQQALALLADPAAKRAFRLEDEPAAIRDLYGRNEYGESFLLARRLVESGVRLVTVVWMYLAPTGQISNVWDNHGGTGLLGSITGYEMLKQPYLLPSFDRAFAALLGDLDQRGLLDETLVAAYGEFGRTPKINDAKNVGRDHWGACQSAVLAGGGVRGGQIFGASDRHAAYPTDNPVSPSDLLATIQHALGVPGDGLIYDQQQRPHRICEGTPILSLF